VRSSIRAADERGGNKRGENGLEKWKREDQRVGCCWWLLAVVVVMVMMVAVVDHDDGQTTIRFA
jgi:hypothetical protein